MDRKQEKRFEIIDYAIEHDWIINPSKGMEPYVENIINFGHCPCDSSRPDCPCPEAKTEVASQGHCLCRLYWASYQEFKKMLRPLKGEKSEGDTA
jgi:ferredoxin-thioredoxin reductase catalytic subunit